MVSKLIYCQLQDVKQYQKGVRLDNQNFFKNHLV